MGKFNSDDPCIYYSGEESLRRKGVALIVNKRVWNAVLGWSLKNDKMISVHLQGKLFNITIIQVYDPITDVDEADQFYPSTPSRNKQERKMSFSLQGIGMQK